MNIKRYFILLFVFLVYSLSYAQTNKWQEIHKVKKSETLFGIARNFGITIDELLDANPEMRMPGYELKKGTTIFIPYAKPKETPKPVEQKPVAKPKKKSIDVGIMLPLHSLDGDGKRMVEYYRGVLMAVEKMKIDGININMKAWNVPAEADIRTILAEESAKNLDIIFGPLYTKQVKALSEFCTKNNTRMVIPFSISGNDVETNPLIYQVFQSQKDITETSINHFLELFSYDHPVIIDCNDTTSNKGVFTFALRKRLEEKGIQYSITNINSSFDRFLSAFSFTKRNIVILNTGRSPELTRIMKKLDELTETNKNLKISMFGYTDWLMYQKYNNNQTYFCKYDTYIPTHFYYNEVSGLVQSFASRFKANFKTDMMNALPRFAATGYDQAMFFIGGLHKYGDNFNGGSKQQYATPLQTPYKFQKTTSGGYRNKAFQLIHFKNDGTIDALSF